MEVHTFLWVVTGYCLRARIIESHNFFFVLHRILVKFHIRTRLIGSFSTTYRSWSCSEEKLHFTPVHTLRQLKHDEMLFPPLPIGLADRNGLKNLPRQFFSACVKFGGNLCRDVETAWPNLSEHLHHTVTLYALCAMSFLQFRMLLFFSITSYPAEIAFFNSPNRELSNGVRVMVLYWNRYVYPSRSPCSRTVDRKSFERRNFLVLRLGPLKIAYFNSANQQLSIDVQPNELR